MPEGLRIAHFTNVYRPAVNGVVTSVATFRDSLTALGHSVFLFAPEHRGYEDLEPLVFRYPALHAHGYPLAIPISPPIDWLLPHLKLDVLHANHPFLLGRVAATKSRRLGIPLVFTYHTRYREYSHYVPALPTSLVEEFLDGWVGRYLAHCHMVVVPTPTIAASLKEKYGLEDGVRVVPTGLHLEKWRQPAQGDLCAQLGWSPQDPVLVSAGRLAEEKNWECLLAAFAHVLREVPTARLAILGEGNDRQALEALARQLGVDGRVHLPGLVSPQQVHAYFKAARLFCFASVTETQGLVTLEAMASGLPVAAVEASGTTDAVTHGQTGLLTPNDPEALAHAVLRLVQDEQLRLSLAERAVEAAGDYDAGRCAVRMVEVYGEATQRQRRGSHLDPVQSPVSFEDRWRRFLGLRPAGEEVEQVHTS